MKRVIEDQLGSAGALGGALGALALNYFGRLNFGSSSSALLSAAINVGAIAAGFLATCQSILLTAGDLEALKRVRKSQHYKRLLAFIVSSIKLSFLLAIVSSVLITLDFPKNDLFHKLAVALWLVVAGAALGSYYRSVNILLILLEGSKEDLKEPSRVEAGEDILPSE